MKIKLSIIFLFTIAFHVCLGQQIDISKKSLKKLFKNTIDKYTFKGKWETTDDDSTYTTADTIKLYNDTYYCPPSKTCCRIMNWHFINGHTFYLYGTYFCSEPPVNEIPSNNKFKIKIKNIDSQLYLRTYNIGKLINNFKILGLKKVLLPNDEYACYQLTLVRVKK